jgi:hypothetical protein
MAKAHVIEGLDPAAPACGNMPAIFSVRLAELWGWVEYMPYPERVRELHDMRIAAKRVRYCFEFFSPALGDGFKDLLKQFKQLQDFLGEIHDCDVWVDYLRSQLREAFRELEAQRKALAGFVGADPRLAQDCQELAGRLAHGPAQGLLMMLEEICHRRAQLYKDLLEFWAKLETDDFRGQLVRAVARAAAGPPPGVSDGS